MEMVKKLAQVLEGTIWNDGKRRAAVLAAEEIIKTGPGEYQLEPNDSYQFIA